MSLGIKKALKNKNFLTFSVVKILTSIYYEFTRMYYVACSRAREDLYIHLPSGFDYNILENAIRNFTSTSGQFINYEFIQS